MIGGNIAAMSRAWLARGVAGASTRNGGLELSFRIIGADGAGRARSIARLGQGSAIFLLGLMIAALYGVVLSDPHATRGLGRDRAPNLVALDADAIDAAVAPFGAGPWAEYSGSDGTVIQIWPTVANADAAPWFGAGGDIPEQYTEAMPYADLASIAPGAGAPNLAPVPSRPLAGSWFSRRPHFDGFLIEAFADSVRSGATQGLAFSDAPVFELGAHGELYARLSSAEALELFFDAVNFDLEDIRKGEEVVPRRYVASLPPDLDSLESTDERKQLFIKAVLPVVLRVNEDIADDRRRLTGLAKRQARGNTPTLVDAAWLDEQYARYEVKSGDFKELLRRVDIIPPSLALAQAAEESGWGTSRFAREGNALFGQYTDPDGEGIAPQSGDAVGKFRIRSYDTLYETVRSYALNLNHHKAYETFRELRAEQRASAGELDGHRLAGTLLRYSERGEDYVKTLRTIMRENALGHFDDVRLGEQTITLKDGWHPRRSS